MVRDGLKLNEVLKYQGKIIDVYNVEFETQTGLFEAEILKHDSGVCIAATHDDKAFYCVDQYRYGVEQIMREFPAGKIDKEEQPLDAALRELREEIGFVAKTLIHLGYIHPSPAYLDEVLYLYYATDLDYVGQELDENEVLNVYTRDIQDIINDIESNKITDAKTISLAYKVNHYLSQKIKG